MSAKKRIWKISERKFDDLEKQLLFNRGLEKAADIDKFLNPSLKDYTKDIAITNIKIAQKRIQAAIENQELIVVFGDYDIDGICASAILYKGLTSLKAKVLPYIPHRDKEGYGLNKTGLEFARDSGATVVITVDNGIVAFNQAECAKELGLDLIITDHHLPLEKLPEAFTIVHSTKMCGASVAWCLIQDLITKDLRQDLLQFAAIATVGDMIPLIGLGRAFVFEGLRSLQKSDNLGLKELAMCSNIVLETIGTYEIGHVIGPRLNAIGRLEHAIDALRLLCTQDIRRARKLAQLLCDTNIKRQEITEVAVNEAGMLIGNNADEQSFSSNKKIHIIDSTEWPAGVIGLIAARVCEQYSVPAIAMSVGESFSKGSARSIKGVDIIELIRQCSDILIDVGGHKGAAGFSIANDKIPEFKKRIEKIVDGMKFDQEMILEIEAEVENNQLTKALIKDLEKFGSFGFGNPQPLFATLNMQISDIRTLKEGKHLKFRANGIDAIAFNMGEMSSILHEGNFVDLAFYLELNKFNGSENLQLKVRDIKLNS